MRRPPWLTLSVLVVTAAVNLGQLGSSNTLPRLERTAAVRHGEPWRLLTSLLVQDGAAVGATINLLGLAVLGALAEQVVSRRWWAAAYLVAGLTGEVVAVWWQPTGGGNSVAVCGLAAVVALAAGRGWRPALPPRPLLSTAALLWAVLMLTSAWTAVFLPGVLVATTAGLLLRGRAAAVVPVAAAGVAVALSSVGNIHGAALVAGLLLACGMAGAGRLPSAPSPLGRGSVAG